MKPEGLQLYQKETPTRNFEEQLFYRIHLLAAFVF